MSSRSALLASGRITGVIAGTNLYTVPAGKVALVKSILVGNGGAASSTWSWYHDPGGGVLVFFWRPTVVNLAVTAFDIWHVMEAGDHLHVAGGSATGRLDYWVSGAEIDA
jgi:hypothetical protein